MTSVDSLTKCSDILAKITIAETDDDRSRLVQSLSPAAGPVALGFVNAQTINLASRDDHVGADFLQLDILLRDGIGLKGLMASLGRDSGVNMNGTDLIPDILRANRGARLALFGTSDPWLGDARGRLATLGHDVVVAIDGFQDFEVYEHAVIEHRPDIILLAMGMPKQEAVAVRLKAVLDGKGGLLICGGAILDFIARRVPRAPRVVRALGLEWLFRLAAEPRRLASRYLLGSARLVYVGAWLRRHARDEIYWRKQEQP